jgi:uncharacterized phage protein (TIGR01671 family)
MRKIKFRVFDKCHKSMHIVGEDTHDSLTCYDGIVQYYNLQNGEGSGEHGDYILMQYTGLKDKNGREIYEGDIVETDLGKGVVVFDSAAFLIRNLEDDEYYGFEDFFSLYEGGCYLVEVLGNIYENPELLGDSNG